MFFGKAVVEPTANLSVTRRLWLRFRYSWLWQTLRRIEFLRTCLYLAMELREVFRDTYARPEIVDRDFQLQVDTWNYNSNPLQQKRFSHQTEVLDAVRGERRFKRALEIGCAEGVFTEMLAPRCESLLILDISPTALARARTRRAWDSSVRFEEWDLRQDLLPGTFDLIVVASVLEYFRRPNTFRAVRTKLVEGLGTGGYLLVETTRSNPVVENSWWGNWFIRGKWINAFMEEHPALKVVTSVTSDLYVISLYQKIG
jgi:SAM-dependent methyltransferase